MESHPLPHPQLLVGTRESDIYEIGKDTKPVAIMHGHSEGQLWGLAVHPTKEWFATGSDDKTIRLWTLDGHRQLCKRSIKEKCRSLCFSPDGDLMAAGMENGSFLLLRTKECVVGMLVVLPLLSSSSYKISSSPSPRQP